jgi:glycosyltransferase involved in cell wall biosynthesis
MTEQPKKISVVIPVYNASTVLYELQQKIDAVFKELNIPYQIVLVDDGSKDDSWKVIKDIKSKFQNNITAIRLAKNFGQHNAISCGFHYCTGDYIITMDDDLQHPAEEIPKLIKCASETGADVVYGISEDYKRPVVRNAFSRLFKVTTRLSSTSTSEGSSFRLLRKSLVKKLITHNQQFVFIDELASWYTSNIEFVHVIHNSSAIKESRYTGSKLMRLYWNLVFGYNGTLLKIITYLGISSSFISFLVGMFFMIKKIFFNVRVGFTGIVVSITFTAGVILLSIGIIGEYMRRMYNILNAQPQHSIGEILE